tara:strand:+ start:172 stop:354 length:183 start_codon:yes stop_codon:yes gene_type:complete
MAKYKAKASFKTAKNKYFGIHKIQILEQGGSIEITDIKVLPESVQKHLEPLKSKKKKGDK